MPGKVLEHDFAKAIEALYKEAFGAGDEAARAIDAVPIHAELPSHPGGGGLDDDQLKFNKYFLFVLKKASAFLISSGTGKAVPSPVVEGVFDALVKALGVPLPSEGVGLIEKRLDDIFEQLKKLKKGQDELKDHITRDGNKREVEKAKVTFMSIWKELKDAVKNSDSRRTLSAIERIRTENVKTALELVNSFVLKVEGALSISIQRACEGKLTSTDSDFEYDIIAYENDVTKCYQYFQTVYHMGMGLVMLWEQCQFYDMASTDRVLEALREDKKRYETELWDLLRSPVTQWPSFKELMFCANFRREQLNHTKHVFLPLYEIKDENGKTLEIRQVVGNVVGGGGSLYDGAPSSSQIYYDYPFMGPDERWSGPTMSTVFALEYNTEKSLWHIRGNKPSQASSACSKLGEWGYLKNCKQGFLSSPYDKYPQLDGGGCVSAFKIIPCKSSENECLVTLVWLNDDRNDKREVLGQRTLCRKEPNYPVFPLLGSDNEAAKEDVFRQHVEGQHHEKVRCMVTNRTDWVLVLDDAHCNENSVYYYANTVWAPGDRYQVAAHGGDINAFFRFAVYEMNERVPDDHDERKRRIYEASCFLPVTGRRGISPLYGKRLTYIWLRLSVPSSLLIKNSISAAEFEEKDGNIDMDSVQNELPQGLHRRVENHKASSTDGTKAFDFDKMKLSMNIEKGLTVAAELEVCAR